MAGPIGTDVGVARENSFLLDRLRSAASAIFLGSISRDDDEGECGIMRLDHGGETLGNGSATGGQDRAGKSGGLGATECEKSRTALLEMPEGPQLGMVRDLADKNRIARAAAEDELIAAEGEEFGDDFSFRFQEREPAQVMREKQERAEL